MSEKLKEYYSNPAVSQSQLKTLVYGPELFLKALEEPEQELYFEEKLYLNIGRAVDTLITGEENNEFEQEFYVSTLQNKPSDIIKSIIQEVKANLSFSSDKDDLKAHRQLIINCCNNHEYYMNWKNDTRVNKIIEAGEEYFKELVNSDGRTILSQEENQKVREIVSSIKGSKFTRKYFEEDFHREIIYQLPIYFKLDNINCKALLDMVIFNHKEKTIQIIDIKTIGDKTSKFHNSIIRHKYFIQAAMYHRAMEYYINVLHTNYSQYKILPFKFLVESTIEVGYPRVFEISQELFEIGLRGRPVLYSRLCKKEDLTDTISTKVLVKHEILGLHQLLNLYSYYMNTRFEKEKDYLENEGHFVVNYEGLIH